MMLLLNQQSKARFDFWGWKRTESDSLGAKSPNIDNVKCLLEGGGHGTSSARFRYFIWMIKVFLAVIRHRPRDIYCVGLETALPVWFACLFSPRTRYIFDDPDRLVMLFSMPGLVKRILIMLEKRVSKKSKAHITPSFQRYNYHNKQMFEVPNTPTRMQVSEANKRKCIPPDDHLSIYINGLLTEARGLNLIIEAAEYLQHTLNEQVHFYVASLRHTDELEPLLSCKNVTYLGALNQIESLIQYTRSHFALTLYDPNSDINRYAVPNKWGDAIFMSTPLLLNDGLITSRPLIDVGAAITMPYQAKALGQMVKKIALDMTLYERAKKGIEALQFDVDYFDDIVLDILISSFELATSDPIQD